MVPSYAAEWKVGSFNFCLRLELLPQTHRVYTTISPLPLYARYHHSHTLFCQQMRIADIFPLACSNTDLMWLTQNWVYIWPEETATDDRLHYMISQGRYRIPWIACTNFMKLQSKFSCRDNIAIQFMFTKSAGYRFTFVFVHFFGSLLRDTEMYWIT